MSLFTLLLPPRLWRRLPFRVGMNAVDWANRQALVAGRAQLGDDDHVYSVVEDGPQRLWASPQAGVAINANAHVDLQRGVLPERVAGTSF